MAAHPSFAALQSIEKLILKACNALDETTAAPMKKPIRWILGASIGAVIGVCASVGILTGSVAACHGCTRLEAITHLGAIVNGGIVSGAAIMASPVIVWTAAGAWLVTALNRRRLVEAEKALSQEALRLQRALLQELEDRRKTLKPSRNDPYLYSLATRLNAAAHHLQAHLKSIHEA
jgi:hypothetical protein